MSEEYTASRIKRLSHLRIDEPPQSIRKTSIICTIGPKTNSVEMICKLRKAGMNIVRLNFSHGDHAYHASVVSNVRQSVVDGERPVAIALDTKGPEIRTGIVACESGYIEITKGHEFLITTDPSNRLKCDESMLYVDYPDLSNVVKPGSSIFIDDGILCLTVIEVGLDYVKVKSNNYHKLLSTKGVNLPKVNVTLPSISEKDELDLKFAVKQELDMIFASFVRKASDIHKIKEILGEEGASIKVIAKIENQEGVNNIDSIIAAADGIMVARGDLGIEIPPEKVFVAQKMIIAKANINGKPVICATQMLESMTVNPRPTRAEVSDVANAVLDGSDCVMLSAETARGNYPVETVEIMSKICKEAENSIAYFQLFEEMRMLTFRDTIVAETIACSAVNASLEKYIKAIIVLTTSGETARLVAKFRPQVPIIVVSRSLQTTRQIHLHRGCYPMNYTDNESLLKRSELAMNSAEWQADVDKRISWAMQEGKKMGLLTENSSVVVIQGFKGGIGNTNAMRIVKVE